MILWLAVQVRVLKSSRVALEGRLDDARAKELATRAAADALRADLDASRAAHQRASTLPVRPPSAPARSGACQGPDAHVPAKGLSACHLLLARCQPRRQPARHQSA